MRLMTMIIAVLLVAAVAGRPRSNKLQVYEAQNGFAVGLGLDHSTLHGLYDRFRNDQTDSIKESLQALNRTAAIVYTDGARCHAVNYVTPVSIAESFLVRFNAESVAADVLRNSTYEHIVPAIIRSTFQDVTVQDGLHSLVKLWDLTPEDNAALDQLKLRLKLAGDGHAHDAIHFFKSLLNGDVNSEECEDLINSIEDNLLRGPLLPESIRLRLLNTNLGGFRSKTPPRLMKLLNLRWIQILSSEMAYKIARIFLRLFGEDRVYQFLSTLMIWPPIQRHIVPYSQAVSQRLIDSMEEDRFDPVGVQNIREMLQSGSRWAPSLIVQYARYNDRDYPGLSELGHRLILTTEPVAPASMQSCNSTVIEYYTQFHDRFQEAVSIPHPTSADLVSDIRRTLPSDAVRWFDDRALVAVCGRLLSFLFSNKISNYIPELLKNPPRFRFQVQYGTGRVSQQNYLRPGRTGMMLSKIGRGSQR